MKTPKKTKKPTLKHNSARHKKAKLIVHKNRKLHHRILLHPISVFVLLCVGVLIVAMTFKASADQYVVRAKVAAPALVTGAKITQPTNGSVLSASTVSVQGSCPPASYVVLYENDLMSGVAWCDGSNTFSIETSLYVGTNALRVQDFNITDDPGPATDSIDVIHISSTPVAYVTGGKTPQQSASDNVVNLPVIVSDYRYQAVLAKSVFEWNVDVTQGEAPYQLTANWGDKTTTSQTVSTPSTVHLSHRYNQAGNYKIVIKAIDHKGFVDLLQLLAVVKTPGTIINSAGTNSPTNIVGETQGSVLSQGFKRIEHWLVFAWGTYATVMLMTVSFWLGERQKVTAIVSYRRPPNQRR